ncbi:MAG: hypothetical protein JXR37_28775 [Kiritimatiellae bacterium]|nr:hypothetical protein [Kiritimatiellia bacterium]
MGAPGTVGNATTDLDAELYGADAVACPEAEGRGPVMFYAFEWRNPRFGRRIEAVRLKGSRGFRECKTWEGYADRTIATNAIVLAALSVVEKRA